MKRIFEVIISAVLCAAVCLSLVGCGGGIEKEEAHSTVSQFFSELVADDAEGAIALTYPALGVESAAFKNYILEVEEECGIKFTDGRSNMRVGTSEHIGGDEYAVGGHINIGDVRISFELTVKSDGGGTGIYRIDIGGIKF